MMRSRPDRSHRREDGFILVTVLWIMLALATLASIYAAYVVRSAQAIGASDTQVRSQALFTAALEMTAYRLTAVAKEKRPAAGRFDFRLGGATVLADFLSEAGRIDLNAAGKPLLASLFTLLGAPAANAETYADRVVAWRGTGGQPGGAGEEAAAYRMAGLAYGPRGAHFQAVGELWLVLGLPPALVDRAMPYLTVYSGLPQVNVVAAPPLVLSALPGIAPKRVSDVLAARQAVAPDPQALLDLLGPARDAATMLTTPAVRVSIGLRFDDGTRANAEVVIMLRDDGQEPYRILSWRDDFDQIVPAGG